MLYQAAGYAGDLVVETLRRRDEILRTINGPKAALGRKANTSHFDAGSHNGA